MAHDGHFVEARLRPLGLDVRHPAGLLLGGQLQALEVLEGAGEIVLALRALALDILQRVAKILTAAVDGAQEGGEGEAADIGIVGPLAFARHALLEIAQLALEICVHAIQGRHAALQIVHPEALHAHQRIAAFHGVLPFPMPAPTTWFSAAYPSAKSGAPDLLAGRNRFELRMNLAASTSTIVPA